MELKDLNDTLIAHEILRTAEDLHRTAKTTLPKADTEKMCLKDLIPMAANLYTERRREVAAALALPAK